MYKRIKLFFCTNMHMDIAFQIGSALKQSLFLKNSSTVKKSFLTNLKNRLSRRYFAIFWHFNLTKSLKKQSNANWLWRRFTWSGSERT